MMNERKMIYDWFEAIEWIEDDNQVYSIVHSDCCRDF